MAMTPNSSATAYAAYSDLALTHDARQLGDLVLDNDTRAPASVLSANPVILAMLGQASGMVEMACFRGGRYSADDLQGLTGVSQQLLIKLVCELAFWNLTIRRHPDKPMSAMAIWAFQTLESLGSGASIFSFVETEAAGNPLSNLLTPQEALRIGLVSIAAERFYGRRTAWNLPFNR